ncbi:TonB-dependent receptor plug domain-containing protein [Undibacterium flavidum]|uniref:TonB-dependent receptor n=1 Tax=Undibacterium flavidum TaxID=2762297 RepID=A0ABR6YGJ7_9BURK|nr:TonB-dependent receptor [Undibacterium flavidum]MBC3875699.1 TonB-dependent receptor [Undibacterium flavidum]
MKSAVQLAIVLLASGGIVNAQEATPAKAGEKAQEVQQVVVTSTGTRGSNRTVIDTPVPVDMLAASDLTKTAQTSLDKALQYRVPSFNTVQTPVNDATSLLDPYEIRNMGPSRSLVLINGKRKNSSSLVYTQTSPGRGESGADISAIPQDAIKRIEVLRDGASAQYGSDAIAGVVNIILKDNPEGGSVNGRLGVTDKGDGKSEAFSWNQGFALGDRGFVNFTLDTSHNALANRPGILTVANEVDYWGADPALVRSFLAKRPDGGNINGSPDTRANKFLINSRYDVSGGTSIYANAAYVDKKIDSYANYRAPYWRPTDFGLLHAAGTPYEGYVPGFLGALKDYNATVGTKFEAAGWDADLSLTFGGNEQKYTVTNSLNRAIEDKFKNGITLPQHGQTRFDAGGSQFTHTVFNADFSKELSKGLNAYFGTEIRQEKYSLIAGDPGSYLYSGADSYAGNAPADYVQDGVHKKGQAGDWDRSNYGIYGGAIIDVSKDFVIDATGRYEKYSDFGNAFIGKLSGKYNVNDQLTLRASVSSGFRAPSLMQIYTEKNQYSFSNGQIEVTGILNNISDDAALLGVKKLKAEKSTNITLGLGYKPTSDTSMTLDYYNISLKDRIILGATLKATGNASSPIDKVLARREWVGLSFFANAMDSKTSGLDYVFSQRNVKLGDAKLTFNLSGNYTLQNERDGNINNPASVVSAGKSVFDVTQDALMFTSRPKFKTILGIDADIRDFNISLNNTVFGTTRFRNADLLDPENLEVVFKTKTVTDFAISYQLSKNLTLAFNVNNMFNVTPSWRVEAINNVAAGNAILNDPAKARANWQGLTFDGRYSMVTYDGSHFSQLGRMYNLSLSYRF